MLKRNLIFALLLLGCGRDGNSPALPPAITTVDEKQQIAQALETIQAELDASGVKKDVSSVPVYVANIADPKVQGQCFRNRKGKPMAIVLRRSLMQQVSTDENLLPWYYTVLLHEIGHCHFGREHENEILQNTGHEMLFTNLSTDHKSSQYRMSYIAPSVMNLNGDKMLLKDLNSYFVREIAGLERIQSWGDLERYTPLVIQSKEQHYQ